MSRSLSFRPVAAILLCAGAAVLVSAPGNPFESNQRAAYLDEKQITFVRPGLTIKVTGAEIAADGTMKATFKLSDARGLPLDREGVQTPGAVSVSFISAYIPRGASQYTAYTTRVQTSPITNVSATQASGESNGKFAKIADGEYTYTFAAKAPASADRTATHTIGAYGSRSLAEFDLGTQYDDDVFHFVPNGSAPSDVRDVVRTATCNKCHQDMGFHGGSRKTMEVCVLCHTPQTIDPDTGNSVDMPVMTHKIHMGASLPSVVAGGKYVIIGNRQSEHDYSGINFPAEANNCLICHEQGTAKQAANVFTKANRAACGACHDNVNFTTGENHLNLPQVTDNQCTSCHVKEGELDFDASILGAHRIARDSKHLPGVVFEIIDVVDATPGGKPTVTFTLKDKKGNPIHPSKAARLNFRLAGPAPDYKTVISEDARKADGKDGYYFWTFLAPIPADAKGTWALGLEGRTEIKVLEGTKQEMVVRDTGLNKTKFLSVDGSKPEPRRTVVSTAKCEACHGKLAFHGDARNTVENCALCHMPSLVAGRGAEAMPVNFGMMVHRIHRGHALSRPYKIGNANFNEIGYPGFLQNCAACHVGNSQQLPLRAGLLPVSEPNGPLQPLMPESGACSGCHDSIQAASHMQANTTKIGEACATCHGPNADKSVNRVHAR
jgi:OmcA/MtrC family decaheme c-type cytochrome